MIIKRGKVFQEDGNFLEQTLYVNDHRLVDKAEYQDDGEVIDAEGLAGTAGACGYPQSRCSGGGFFRWKSGRT